MSFTESTLVKKLLDLNSSQQSIQTLSLWVIHHRKHYSLICKTWFKEFQKVAVEKKLTYMYLANDVIQNSKKKGPEYGKEFENYLLKAFRNIADTCANPNIFRSLDRLLNIWEERTVYDAEHIKRYRTTLHSNGEGGTPEPQEEEQQSPTPQQPPPKIEKKRKSDNSLTDTSTTTSSKKSKPTVAAAVAAPAEIATIISETIDENGTVETHVTLNAVTPSGDRDPPEPEELVKALLELENSASSDAVVRGKIANLPSELSDISYLGKIEDKEAAARFAVQVNEAVHLLNEYNARLATEMENRKRLAVMLRDFLQEQKELLQQAEQRLDEYNKKLNKVKTLQREVRNHLQNLPDLKQLPDVTGGLAPLPSAGDLFNIH